MYNTNARHKYTEYFTETRSAESSFPALYPSLCLRWRVPFVTLSFKMLTFVYCESLARLRKQKAERLFNLSKLTLEFERARDESNFTFDVRFDRLQDAVMQFTYEFAFLYHALLNTINFRLRTTNF